MSGSKRGPGRLIKADKIYLTTNITDPKPADKGFVEFLNVAALKRLIVRTEKGVRQGRIFRFKLIYVSEGDTIATTVRLTILGTNDLTADPAISDHIILRTDPITLSVAPSIAEDNNIGTGIEFDTVDETGPAATPPVKNEGELQFVLEQVGGSPDSKFKCKIYGDSDD